MLNPEHNNVISYGNQHMARIHIAQHMAINYKYNIRQPTISIYDVITKRVYRIVTSKLKNANYKKTCEVNLEDPIT